MPGLPVLSGREAIRAFERAGWQFQRQRGSHVVLTKPGSWASLSIPIHTELDRGLLHKLIKQAGLSVDEFIKLTR